MQIGKTIAVVNSDDNKPVLPEVPEAPATVKELPSLLTAEEKNTYFGVVETKP